MKVVWSQTCSIFIESSLISSFLRVIYYDTFQFSHGKIFIVTPFSFNPPCCLKLIQRELAKGANYIS
jgi:hypothetical protein